MNTFLCLLTVLLSQYLCTLNLSAQTPTKPNTFCFLSIVRSQGPLVLKIGPNPIGEEGWGIGIFSGVLTWTPFAPLNAELKGYKPSSFPIPKDLKSGQCPILVIYDALESAAPDKPPEPILKWLSIENASDRSRNFFDAIDLTTDKLLELKANGKVFRLTKGKRQRLSTESSFYFKVVDGPEGSYSPSEAGLKILLIFYTGIDGKTACTSVPDSLDEP
ncbi:MAG: hypothetical protein EBT45_09200 [Alphaproteobacteria bacterium]|nr:hypothetical protein [Alphaproteobacteria bacterium]